MADDKKISDLPVASTPLAGTELIEIVQGGVNKQTTASQFGGSGSVPDASESTKGIAKLNDTGALGSATDAAPTQRATKEYADTKSPKAVQFACSDETTSITTGTKLTFRMPYAMTVTAVVFELTTAQTSGSVFTVDVKKNGTTILSTKVTFDNGEKDSADATTPPVISVSSLAYRDEISVEVTQIGDGTAKGLKGSMIGV